MTAIEILEQDAKDRGLIDSVKEHAFWGLTADEQILGLQGYRPVKDKKNSITVEEMTLYKIDRLKEEIVKLVAAAKGAKRKK